MTNNHMKRCSALLGTRKMQVRTTVRYHFIPTWMVTVKRWPITSVDGKAEKLEPSCATAGNKNGVATLRKQVGGSLKV